MSFACKFNGSSSKIDLGSDVIGVKAVTVMGWIKPYSTGESEGQIINNGRIYLGYDGLNKRVLFSSETSTYLTSGTNSVSLNKWQFISITREADGTVNFYIGDKSTAPALSGSADQDSGTPAAGTTNVIIGNNSGATRTFDGTIPKLKVIEGILTLAQITQVWSETRKEII